MRMCQPEQLKSKYLFTICFILIAILKVYPNGDRHNVWLGCFWWLWHFDQAWHLGFFEWRNESFHRSFALAATFRLFVNVIIKARTVGQLLSKVWSQTNQHRPPLLYSYRAWESDNVEGRGMFCLEYKGAAVSGMTGATKVCGGSGLRIRGWTRSCLWVLHASCSRLSSTAFHAADAQQSEHRCVIHFVFACFGFPCHIRHPFKHLTESVSVAGSGGSAGRSWACCVMGTFVICCWSHWRRTCASLYM
jgi:hypothetical protein